MNILDVIVKIKTVEDVKRLIGIRRQIETLNPGEDIAKYALKRIIHYSPESIKDGWDVQVSGNTIKFVHNRVDEKILWYLELGTVAHYVRPVAKEALHWVEGGQDFFSKGHMVSGIRAHLFFTRARSDTEAYANKRYGRNVKIEY